MKSRNLMLLGVGSLSFVLIVLLVPFQPMHEHHIALAEKTNSAADNTPLSNNANGIKVGFSAPATIYASDLTPIHMKITDSNQAASEISITLTNLRNSEGFSGYTKSVTANDHIIRSDITIYAIDSLTDEQIETITRHEFGHALGLGHSSAPSDLMHDTVRTPSFVSGCDIEEIRHVYNAERNIAFKCEIFN